MRQRYERINQICIELSQEAFKSYAGKKDYKRALELYTILATYNCIPRDISNFANSTLSRLSKKIEDTK